MTFDVNHVRYQGKTYRVATLIRYRITGTYSARDNGLYVYRKGPAVIDARTGTVPEGGMDLFGGESVAGEFENASSDGAWHTLNQNGLIEHPLPVGKYPYPGQPHWLVWYHWLFSVWPHGHGYQGCYFYLDV